MTEETLTLSEYRREEAQQDAIEDNRLIILSGIVGTSGEGGHCFKVKGDNDSLQKIKRELVSMLKEKGYRVKLEHGYYDE